MRAQAQDLLSVLEAPALERPRDWSITLPDLGSAEAMGGQMQVTTAPGEGTQFSFSLSLRFCESGLL